MTYEAFKKKHKRGPRITSMSSAFNGFVDGTKGKPIINYKSSKDLLKGDVYNLSFYFCSQRYATPFTLHASASIPFSAEGDYRLGAGILRYAKLLYRNEDTVFNVQEIAGADGGFSRTLANLSNGKIRSLTNSATYSNYTKFLEDRPENCFFWPGPFFEITSELLYNTKEFHPFRTGFDLIYEHIIFQMFNSNRQEQIKFVSKNLKADGILLLYEKNKHVDIEEYIKREKKKDNDFKSKYFSDIQVQEKKDTILYKMEEGEVTLKDLTDATSKFFQYVVLIWNCCNFNVVAASNSKDNLEKFIGELTEPCLPEDYCYEQVPQVLFGKGIDLSIKFRDVIDKSR